jgi:hypothetical protein
MRWSTRDREHQSSRDSDFITYSCTTAVKLYKVAEDRDTDRFRLRVQVDTRIAIGSDPDGPWSTRRAASGVPCGGVLHAHAHHAVRTWDAYPPRSPVAPHPLVRLESCPRPQRAACAAVCGRRVLHRAVPRARRPGMPIEIRVRSCVHGCTSPSLCPLSLPLSLPLSFPPSLSLSPMLMLASLAVAPCASPGASRCASPRPLTPGRRGSRR